MPADTIVYDAIDGNPIGDVTAGFTNEPATTKNGWSQFVLRSEFGDIAVWAKKP